MHPEATGFRVGPYPSGGIDEQAREEERRTGRATANAAVAEQAGRRPAWPAVAEQAGQPARAQADNLADAARTRPLSSTLDKWRSILLMGRRCISANEKMPPATGLRRRLRVARTLGSARTG